MTMTYSGKKTSRLDCPPKTWTDVTSVDVPQGDPVDTMIALQVKGQLEENEKIGWFRVRMVRDNGDSTAVNTFTPVSWPGGRFTHWIEYTWFGKNKMDRVTWQVYSGDYIKELYVTIRYCKAKD